MNVLFSEISDYMEITGEDTAHLFALRPKAGDTMKICDGKGLCCLATVDRITRNSVCFSYLSELMPENEPEIKVTVCAALLKSGKNDTVIQKSVELGASEIIFFESENCVAEEKGDKNERRQKISRQEAMQSGRELIPPVRSISFSEALVYAEKFDLRAFFHEKATVPFSQHLKKTVGQFKNAIVFIGPEGGFTEKEVEAAKEHELTPFLLGKRILRAETVPLCALSIVMSQCDEI